MVVRVLLPQTQDFNIRYVQEKDYPYVFEMIKRVITKAFPNKEINEDKINNLFDKALDNDEFTGIILVDSEDIPKGYILGLTYELYFDPEKVATCLSIWVEEDCRGHSLDMVRAFQAWAKYKGATTAIMSEYEGLSPKGLKKMFSMFDFKLKENQYWKEL